MSKSNLNKAFRELRKAGYVAKQNFGLSLSDAIFQIDDIDNIDKLVFYQQQDNDDLNEFGECYLAWFGDANEIINILNNNNIVTEWDGKNHSRIKISIK